MFRSEDGSHEGRRAAVVCFGAVVLIHPSVLDSVAPLRDAPTMMMGGAVRARVVAFCCFAQQDACMASITIRDVPDEARDELASRAASSGKSLQEYLRGELIELARRPDAHVLIARIRERKERTGGKLSAKRILEHRGADRK